ncbi:MAG: LysR family transcriptional regulator [Rhodospirillales bacterium]
MHASVLRYVDHVARHGSIRRAAAAMNVASSAINRQILRLERDLGAPLFVRRRDGVGLTAVGEMLLSHVRDTLDDFRRVRDEIEGLRGVVTGQVRLAALDSLLVQFVPGTLAAIAARHPHLSFSVMALGPANVAEELRSGRADIAISFVDRRHRDIEVAAECKASLGAVVTRSHPLAGRRRLSLRDCADYPAILVQDRMPLTPTLEAEFAARRTVIRGRVISNSLEFMRAMLLAGLGVGFFTSLGFAREIARGDLVYVPLVEPRLRNISIGVMTARRRALAPAAELVLGEICRNWAALSRKDAA